MLLTKEVKIKIAGPNKKYYQEKGYECENGDIITVKIEDVPLSSHIKVKVKCDYCGEEFEKTYDKYNRARQILQKDACKNCCKKKNEEIMMLKYGVKVPLQLQEVKDKVKETNLKIYGTENPAQNKDVLDKIKSTNQEKYGYNWVGSNPEFREKQEETMLEKYGVKNCFCNGELRDKSYQKVLESKEKNNSMIASKSQIYLSELYNCQCNKLVFLYFLDLYFENEKIYGEYDGGGHRLNVRLGQSTQEDFDKREKQRYHILKRNGLKVFRIINEFNNEKLPNDEVLLAIKELALKYLSEKENYWIVFDFDKKEIRIKTKIIKCSFEKIEDIKI